MNALDNKNRIIIFLRAPEKGKVKTRLAKTIGQKRVLELYKGFVYDTLLAAEPVSEIVLFCWPTDRQTMISNWLKNQYKIFPQSGEDIGIKMANAFQETFRNGVEKAILIGTDIPDISDEILTAAFSELDRNDTVLGPSKDGGYYLVGFNKNSFSTEIFKEVNWSTATVLNETLDIIKGKKYRFHLLPELNDIDTDDDLDDLSRRCIKGHKTGSNTEKNLMELALSKP